MGSGISTPDEVKRRLENFRARRGYLMPHQGAMAAALPDLQDAYGPFYRTLTIDIHHLTEFEREFLWLVLLVTAEEHLGTHHVSQFYETGGSPQQADAAFRLVAWSGSTTTYKFLSSHWQKYFPEVDAGQAYLDGSAALMSGFDTVPLELARLSLLSAHAARGDYWGLAQEIKACYSAQASEGKMAEALSLVLWPCGINRYIEACGVWLDLMRSGAVIPSPSFQAWADTPDQDGFPLAARPWK